MNKYLLILLFSLLLFSLNAEELPYSTFKEAYNIEKKELESQIKMLSEYKIKKLQEHNRQKKEIKDEINRLTEETNRIKTQNINMNKRRKELERAVTSLKYEKNMLSETIKLLFANKIKKIKEKDDFSSIFIDSFNKKVESVTLNDHIRKEKVTFFTKEGEKEEKEEKESILIGDLAAYTVSKGSYNVLNRDSGTFFTYLTEKQSNNNNINSFVSRNLFFWNENAKYKEVKTDESFITTVKKGGIIAFLILVLAFFAVLIVVERVFTLFKLGRNSPQIFNRIKIKAEKGEKVEIKGRTPFENVAKVVLNNQTLKREAVEEKAKEAILKELPILQRLLPVMNIVAAVAPLMGLLGTVTGIISTFNAITAYGSGDPKIVSFGISEALITTEFGLAVAIPVLIVHALLSRWSDKISDDMEQHTLSLINTIKGN